MRERHRYSYYAFALNTGCAIAAFWLPRTVAVGVGLTWIVWLILAVRKREE
jgi:hypothetical protein